MSICTHNPAALLMLLAPFAAGCSGGDRAGGFVDRSAIITTVNRLFIETDNRNWGAVAGCFADSVLFDMTSLAGGQPVKLSPRQITDTWDRGLKPLKAIHHQVGNHLVSVSGDQATAFCYGIASHYLPTPDDRNTRTFVGSYDFQLRRTVSGWKIDMFKFNLKYIEGNLTLGSPPSPK